MIPTRQIGAGQPAPATAIDWCNYLPRRTTSAKLDDICSQAPCVIAVPDEDTQLFVLRLLADWHRSGVAGADQVTVRLGGMWQK